ncbi:MAG: RNA polymerase sigma factor (sigma-70 family) [Paracoccaceae bacterium]|jgi:RNA polymerase sigma factor (sigma-70 family)
MNGIFFICGDPISDRPRKSGMFMALETPTFADAPAFRLPYGRTTKARVDFYGGAKLAKAEHPDRTLWVAHLEAIRDKQDEKAFAEIFQHFAPRVKGFLIKSGASAELAEECTQDVMATLWRKAHLFDPTRASVSTWIFTIARNRKIDLLRKQRRPEPEDLTWGPEAEPDQTDALTLQQDTKRLGEALAALPEKQRNLIERAYFGDLTHSEIADETGLPLGTIKSRIRLALDRLRHTMK